jgi:ribosomal protein L29
MAAPKKKKSMPKRGSDKAFEMAEKRLQQLMDQGKVNPGNIAKVRERIANRFGAYPMGGTR